MKVNTREIIAALQEADPDGSREVWLRIHNGERASDARTFHDPSGSVEIDEAGDVVITGETQ